MQKALICALLLLVLCISPSHGQCLHNAACIDCFLWCPSQKNFCDQAIVKQFCRKSCKFCPEENSLCQALNCDQRCLLSDELQSAKCACFDGYQLDGDGRSCNDINECDLDPMMCEGTGATFCNNTLGHYACTSCKAYSNGRMWSYYERDECCASDHTSQCGKSSTNTGRIVGGRNARVKRWPWTAYIAVQDFLCGGSLITDRHVLTAAHCFRANTDINEVTVTLGVLHVINDGNIHVQTFRVSEIHSHPRYRFPDHDVTILVLDRPAILSGYVYPVCLPGGHRPKEGEVCWATGYGITNFKGKSTNTLQEVDLPIVNISVCEDAYKNESRRVNPAIHMCAGYVRGGKDACQGDSGGPLVCQRCNSCDWYLAGVTSFGKGCGKPGFYGVYSRVLEYEGWITGITRQTLVQSECVKPSWHAWGPWTNCSADCGTGMRSRSRFCINGVEGLPGCIGKSFESIRCNAPPCRNGSWSSWATRRCSETCGRGKRTKTRTCLNGVIGNAGCPAGGDTMTEVCNTQQCPQWGAYGGWSVCSVTCGMGVRTSSRICNTFDVEDVKCEGNDTRVESCQTANACSEWTAWEITECSVTCGGGIRTRTRKCVGGVVEGIGCEGEPMIREVCNTQCCPIWGEFGPFNQCNVSCGGGGVQTSTRTCACEEKPSQACSGSDTMVRECGESMCPGEWTNWSNDGECTVTCGTGDQPQRRECVGGIGPGGPGCEGSRTRVLPCEQSPCPEWGVWSSFGVCSRTCGGGSQSRSRECVGGNHGSGGCVGEAEGKQQCNTNSCPTQTGSHCSLRSNTISLGDVKCCQYAASGFCSSYSSYMETYCSKACCENMYLLECTGSSNSLCQDLSPAFTCAFYKQFRVCRLVSSNCAFTCGYC